jgi:hypothetical protein
MNYIDQSIKLIYKSLGIIYRAKEGDKKMIFGRPAEFTGGKWEIKDTKQIESNGIKDTKNTKDTFKKSGINYSVRNKNIKVSENILNQYKSEFNELLEMRQAIIDNYDELKRLFKKASEIEEGSKEYKEIEKLVDNNPVMKFDKLNKRRHLFSPDADDTADDIVDFFNLNSKTKVKGDHWGASHSSNAYSKRFAIINSNIYRPIDRIPRQAKDIVEDKEEMDIKDSSIEFNITLGQRNYAQQQIKKFSQKNYPYVMRGMTLTEDTLSSLSAGKELNLTGCTSFTFDKDIAEHYATSEWSQASGGSDRLSCVLKCKRTEEFDDSVGMWHLRDNDESKPAYEILSGIEKVKVNNIKKREDGIYEIECEGVRE